MASSMLLLSSASAWLDYGRQDPLSAALRLIGIAIAVYIARALLRIYVWNLWLSPVNKIPGPRPTWLFPPLGSFPEIMREEACAPHFRWMREYAEDIGIVKYHTMLLTPRVLVTNPDLVRYVLSVHSYDFPKETVSGPIKRIFGSGLLFSDGDVHKRQRRLLNPAFSYRNVREMLPSLWAHAWAMADRLGLDVALSKESTKTGAATHPKLAQDPSAPLDCTTIDIHEAMGVAALDMIGTVGFGYEFNGLKTELASLRNKLRAARNGDPAPADEGDGLTSELSRSYNKLMGNLGVSVSGVLLFFFPFLGYVYKPKNRRNIEEALVNIDKAAGELIRNKKEARKNDRESGGARKEKQGKDLLELLMEEAERDGTQLEDEELRDQILTFLTAGHETTALSVSWTLWLLAHNQSAQKKLFDEISSSPYLAHLRAAAVSSIADPFMSKTPATISPESLDSLQYLNMVVKESLRLIPPAPMISTRVVQNDITVNVNDRAFLLPKGTPLVFAPVMNHKLPSYWKRGDADAEADSLEEFVPERWNAVKESEEAAGMSAVWLPFSMGPRGCIGQKLALLEAKILLAIIVSRFEFEAVPDYTVGKKLRVTWRPDRPLLVRVRERFSA
ncbi:cytochrome P450 [Gonapodya prolifera JEL478]|uniref:Cytochrome P450 n=1 Tax=Gonapodya prolifera (strain JEL478) TaxID=1344416 RepID=A0A139AUW2_GONPJ|nr:cytochrome P450 [Gonapodya prolifera JEL478]|eukprot:KXS20373.1 cytochrome P450 [Gonapodya prolifera JEL478]